MPSNITPRQAALWFAGQGFAVFPLHSIKDDGTCTCGDGCTKDGKKTGRGKHLFAPFVPNGHKDATTDPSIISSWFDQEYWLSYGISCDKLLVCDVDPRNGGEAQWSTLCNVPSRPLINTWQVRTGKYGDKHGRHIMFRNTPGIRKGALDKGIEIQGAGSYIVGPGCRHHTGVTYQFLPQCSPDSVTLAEVPAWLLAIITTRSHCGRPKSISEWRAIAGGRVADGERHQKRLQLIGHLVGLGVDAVVARDLVLSWNQVMCDPPESSAVVIRDVEDIVARELQKHQWLKAS